MFIFACYHIDVGLEKMIWSLSRTITENPIWEPTGILNILRNRAYTGDPKHLTFDPEESYYVRMIFTWALEGISSTVIARRLRDMKAPVPPSNEYQRPSLIAVDDPQRWSITMVNTILKNRIYTGDFICGKSCRRKCDPFNYRPKIPQEEWVIIPDSHPAYITHKEFDQIARRMNEYSNRRNRQIRKSAPEYKRNPNIYRSKLVCPVCGGMMSASLAKRNQPANRLHYVCFREASRVQKVIYFPSISE